MEKTRKNFNFNSELIEKAEMKAAQTKRSLTAHIEYLLEKDLQISDKDEFFEHMNKRHEGC